MRTTELVTYLNDYLHLGEHDDRSNNGLQVEGAASVTTAAFAVDACQTAFEAAREAGRAIPDHPSRLVLERGELLTGPHFKRIKTLLDANIGLYGVHLPLDTHPEVGNNVELCRLIGLTDIQPWGEYHGQTIGYGGALPRPITLNNLAAKIDAALGVNSRVLAFGPQVIDRVAVCSGGASSLIPQVVAAGYSTYFSGEASHSAYHDVKDYGLNVIYAGHYATETVGLKALARHLETKFGLRTVFLDLPTGL